jgi:hypothetical protein
MHEALYTWCCAWKMHGRHEQESFSHLSTPDVATSASTPLISGVSRLSPSAQLHKPPSHRCELTLIIGIKSGQWDSKTTARGELAGLSLPSTPVTHLAKALRLSSSAIVPMFRQRCVAHSGESLMKADRRCTCWQAVGTCAMAYSPPWSLLV